MTINDQQWMNHSSKCCRLRTQPLTTFTSIIIIISHGRSTAGCWMKACSKPLPSSVMLTVTQKTRLNLDAESRLSCSGPNASRHRHRNIVDGSTIKKKTPNTSPGYDPSVVLMKRRHLFYFGCVVRGARKKIVPPTFCRTRDVDRFPKDEFRRRKTLFSALANARHDPETHRTATQRDR